MKRRRGYTVVELMMALAVFATGVTGIIAMQRATVSSNHFAKTLTIADGIAQACLSQLQADGTLWTTNLNSTVWLQTVTGSNGVWQLPAYDNTRKFGAQFDGFGAPTAANGEFCAHIRLTWLYGDGVSQAGSQGNGLIRAEVRVFWPRDGATRVTGDCTNAAPAIVTQVGAATGTYHFVTHAGAVRQPQQRN
jgi:prepilin-type N-terminal cleavage/methylation domain-containing protein